MLFNLPAPLFAITEFWMARWLTPVWFVGVGVTFGLIALAILFGLFYVLSKVPFLDGLRKSGAAHIIALLVTIGGTAAFSSFLLSMLKTFSETVRTDEWLLLTLASGVLLGLLVWSLLYCSSSRFIGESKALLTEGIGMYILSTFATVAVVGWACTLLVDAPMAAFRSLPQLFSTGATVQKFEVQGSTDDDASFQKIAVKYDVSTIDSIELMSNKNLLIGDGPSVAEFKLPGYRVEAGVPIKWNRTQGALKSPLPIAAGADVYVQNQEIDSANLEIRTYSIAPVRESTSFILVAAFVVIVGLILMLMQAVSPKTAAIALSAAKSELSQPLPVILMLLVSIAILLFVYLPFHTFGEDIKLLKDCGVTLILIAASFQAVWSASTSVNEEIEGRTALTLLSKPIHRRSFIIGKILGVFWIVLFMFMVLGAFELLAVAYKPIYDARESSQEQPPWQMCHFEMMQTMPGLAMAFFQSVVLGSFAVALGTRLSLISNFTICFAIYLLGHLTPTIVAAAEGGLPLVEFFSQLISAVIPNLNLFSMEAAIDSDVGIPWSVLAAVLVYTTLYFVLATLLGLLLFEDRDLA